MFKEYLRAGHQVQPASNQGRVGIDLMQVVGYIHTPTTGYVTFYCTGLNSLQVHMTQAEFDEFKTNLRTANRLKRGYE